MAKALLNQTVVSTEGRFAAGIESAEDVAVQDVAIAEQYVA
jgi:hypothetical protein